MTTKWKLRNDESGNTFTVEEAIRRIVDDAPDYRAGTVETVEARLNKLMQIVGTIAAAMPSTAQRIVIDNSSYQFTEVRK